MAVGTAMEIANLFRPDFIDPDAGYVRISLRDFLGVVEAIRAYDRESGDGFETQRQVPGSTFRNFPAATEVAAHVDDAVLD